MCSLFGAFVKLAQKGVRPPFVPTIGGGCGDDNDDTDEDDDGDHFAYNFDAQFTGEPAVLSPDDS